MFGMFGYQSLIPGNEHLDYAEHVWKSIEKGHYLPKTLMTKHISLCSMNSTGLFYRIPVSL